jgi:hypothetical protein
MQVVQEVQEFAVFFVDANDFGAIVGLQVGKEDGALFSELREAAPQRYSVGAGFFIGETLEQKSFDLRRDSVLETFGFVVGFRPGKADDLGEQHFGELMAESHTFGNGAAFASQIDASVASYGDKIVAAHPFECGSDSGGSDAEFFRKTRADGRLALFDEFPDGFEIVFLGDAGLCTHEIRQIL